MRFIGFVFSLKDDKLVHLRPQNNIVTINIKICLSLHTHMLIPHSDELALPLDAVESCIGYHSLFSKRVVYKYGCLYCRYLACRQGWCVLSRKGNARTTTRQPLSDTIFPAPLNRLYQRNSYTNRTRKLTVPSTCLCEDSTSESIQSIKSNH